MTDPNRIDGTEQITAYADHGCPKADDGIHVWSEAEEAGVIHCENCGALKA